LKFTTKLQVCVHRVTIILGVLKVSVRKSFKCFFFLISISGRLSKQSKEVCGGLTSA